MYDLKHCPVSLMLLFTIEINDKLQEKFNQGITDLS